MNLLERLTSLGLLVVTGKGGVGKSTLTAALGLAFARRGRRVLLLEIDPRESLYQLLDVDPSGGGFVRVDDRLFVQNLGPSAVVDELVRERLPFEALANRLARSPIYRHFTETAPGLKEMAALGHAARVVQGLAGGGAPNVDMVILDAPATGHGVSMLAAPGVVSEVIRDGPIAHMGAELTRFIADPETCGVLIATAAEEMPAQEAIETIDALEKRVSRRPEVLAVNALYPTPPAGLGESSVDPALKLWLRRRAVNERELRRLAEAWHGPRIELPLLPLDRGAELAETLSHVLEGELEGRASWN